MKTLKQMPIPVAALIMVLLIMVGLALGNEKALSAAKEGPEAILAEVSAMASQRASQAKNLLVVANRNDVEAQNTNALNDAIGELEDAQRANKIASANRQLTFTSEAVNESIQRTASEQDRRLATGVMDEMGSLDKLITRRANVYNESLDDVMKLYNSLPMRWVIGGRPEVYQ